MIVPFPAPAMPETLVREFVLNTIGRFVTETLPFTSLKVTSQELGTRIS